MQRFEQLFATIALYIDCTHAFLQQRLCTLRFIPTGTYARKFEIHLSGDSRAPRWRAGSTRGHVTRHEKNAEFQGDVTHPPKVVDCAQLSVSRIQEAVGPGGPALVNGGHGRQGPLQTQEVFLHLREEPKLSAKLHINMRSRQSPLNATRHLRFSGWWSCKSFSPRLPWKISCIPCGPIKEKRQTKKKKNKTITSCRFFS